MQLTKAEGLNDKLSPHTVNDHVRHVYEKAGVRGRRELVAWLFFSRYAPTLGGAQAGPPAR